MRLICCLSLLINPKDCALLLLSHEKFLTLYKLDISIQIHTMSLEQEPLLQHNLHGPRPSRKWWTKISRGEQLQEEGKVGHDEKQDIAPRTFSLTAILKLTTSMIILSLLIALFLPERLVLPVACAQNGGLGIQARVDKILSENPLIGCTRFLHIPAVI